MLKEEYVLEVLVGAAASVAAKAVVRKLGK